MKSTPLETPWPPIAGAVTHRGRHCYQIGQHFSGRLASRWFTLYPSGLTELVIGLDGGPLHAGEPAGSFASPLFGPRSRPTRIRVDGPARTLGIHMAPWIAHAALGISMHNVVNATVDLCDVEGPGCASFVSALRLTRTWPEAFAMTDHFLLERLGTGPPDEGGVACSYLLLAQHEGRLSVGELAARTGMSERLLEMRFREQVGLSPKALARLLRLQHALRLLAEGRVGAAVAMECGYYDQAHLSRECKGLTGHPPSSFAKAGRKVKQSVRYFGFVQDWLVGLDDHDGSQPLHWRNP